MTLSRSELERLAGTYKDADSGLVGQVDVVSNRLRFRLGLPGAEQRYRMAEDLLQRLAAPESLG